MLVGATADGPLDTQRGRREPRGEGRTGVDEGACSSLSLQPMGRGTFKRRVWGPGIRRESR